MALAEKKIQLNSNGLAWRPNLYIGDIPIVLNAVLNCSFDKPTVINIGNHKSNLRVLDVVEIIKDINNDVFVSVLESGGSSLYRDQYVTNKKDERSYKVDFSKMKCLLGEDMCSTNLTYMTY